jgi:hypothetical protein
MKLKARKTHSFVEIKVDEIETTIFKSDPKEIEQTIHNLLEVARTLASYTEKSISDFVTEGDF